ncbi:hypothetical protein DY000_02040753 [Brassica cretica]|uniref:Uncharacterized protein n=1 Tax=Brassica cretica TaxID=69181 RepID=A0ABQ7BPJ6_BRACR|nr:hypothetical protein DY000_02040753 [Brassica cretica]
MDTTTHCKQHVQEFYSGSKSQLGYLQVPRGTSERPPSKSQATISRRGKKLQLRHQNLKEHKVC